MTLLAALLASPPGSLAPGSQIAGPSGQAGLPGLFAVLVAQAKGQPAGVVAGDNPLMGETPTAATAPGAPPPNGAGVPALQTSADIIGDDEGEAATPVEEQLATPVEGQLLATTAAPLAVLPAMAAGVDADLPVQAETMAKVESALPTSAAPVPPPAVPPAPIESQPTAPVAAIASEPSMPAAPMGATEPLSGPVAEVTPVVKPADDSGQPPAATQTRPTAPPAGDVPHLKSASPATDPRAEKRTADAAPEDAPDPAMARVAEAGRSSTGQPRPIPDLANPTMPPGAQAAPAADVRPADTLARLFSNAGDAAPPAKAESGVMAMHTTMASPPYQAMQSSALPLPATPVQTQVPIAAVAIHIAHTAQSGAKRFEIRLDPPELGRVEVRLDVTREGHATTHLVVERSETLDMLQRDARHLERALQNAGLNTSDGGLTFSLKDHGQTQKGFHQAPDTTPRSPMADEELPLAETAPIVHRLGVTGLDIRI